MRDIKFGDAVNGVEWHKIRLLENECWEWTGKVRATGQPAHVHRILLEARTGRSFHKSKLICNTERCVNPYHREWYGSQERISYWVCSVEDCVKPVAAQGMCSTHHTRVKRGLDIEPEDPRDFSKGVCTWGDCSFPVRSNALCSTHYRREREGRDMDKPLRAWYGPRECSLPGCERSIEAKGLCSLHYQREQAGRDLSLPVNSRSPRPPGEWYPTDEGYMMRSGKDPDTGKHRRYLQHRVVMEEEIGRPLRREETVHHINGVRDDNRIENLELWSSSHPPGQRVEDKLAWAEEMIRLYGAGH